MPHLLDDLRQACRSLCRRPALSLLAVATLAVGMAGGTAVFSVADGVLFRPLAIPGAERLLQVREERVERNEVQRVSPPAFRDLAEAGGPIAGAAAFTATSVVITGDGAPRRVPALAVSPGFLGLLGFRPAGGRALVAADAEEAAPPVALLAHDFALRRFGGPEAAVGRRLETDSGGLRVVGVLPPRFWFPQPAQVLVPLRLDEEMAPAMRGARYLDVLARLAPGEDLEAARTAAAGLAERAADEHPVAAGWTYRLTPLSTALTAAHRPLLLNLLVAVGLLLLIACVNVVHLLLARAEERRREMAVRRALGAGPGRLLRQTLAEGVLLAAAGGAAGVGLAVWVVEALVRWLPAELPRLDGVAVDGRVLAVSAATVLGCGLLVALAPALRALRADVRGDLAVTSAGGGGGRDRMRDILVVGEIALALVLLVAAGAVVRSFHALSRVEVGFAPRAAAAVPLVLPEQRYPGPQQRTAFAGQLLAAVTAEPGVRTAAVSTNLPFSGSNMTFGYRLPDGEERRPGEQTFAEYHAVSPDYFRTLGVPLLAGRPFGEGDRAGAPPVVIVNRTLARRHFAPGQAVGRRLALANDDRTPRTIVGVVDDVRHFGFAREPVPEAYVPFAQQPWSFFTLVARSGGGDAAALLPSLAAAVWRLDPALPADGAPVSRWLAEDLAAARVESWLLSLFGAVALALAAVGVHGVVAYAVGRRQREIGIRLALGATRGKVVRRVLARSLLLAAAGIAAGSVAARLGARWLDSALFGTGAAGTTELAAVAVLLAATVTLAAALPARRATRVDPVRTLRSE